MVYKRCYRATVRPYGGAKIFRDCARFRVLKVKMHILSTFYLFWVIFVFFWGVLPYLFAKNFLTKIDF